MNDLIADFEKATEPSRELDARIWCAVKGYKFLCLYDWGDGGGVTMDFRDNEGQWQTTLWSAYTKSLDAARTLLLPGYSYSVNYINGHGASARVWKRQSYESLVGPPDSTPVCKGANEATALTIAALRARQSAALGELQDLGQEYDE